MKHPYRIREIATQCGLSESTVDRVLNRRGNVRASTIREVEAAIADLDRQRDQVRLAGRTFFVDVVMQAPDRFSGAVRAALEAELPYLRPAVIRSRFYLRETVDTETLVARLDRIGARGSHGVVLKATDVPEVTEAVDRLDRAGVPVVTLVTDLPQSSRHAYVGIDNRAAGQTAAYLLGQWLGDRPGNVLVTLSSSAFRGEEEREIGFRAALRRIAPGRQIREITETDGLDATMRALVREALIADPTIAAVYSIGGGNVATVETFEELGRPMPVFIGHDVDDDNRDLLRRGRLAAVLDHDLRQDMRRACQLIMQAQEALPALAGVAAGPSPIQVVTPYNLPVPAAPAAHSSPRGRR
ncbi:MAG: LacI family DNA-binding transcriptional regulator [Nocardioidaceae bacterium]